MLHRYVHGNGVDQPLVWYTGNTVSASTRRHLFANWQGSITAITDATGNAIAVNAYDAYGIPNDTNVGRFQYTGQILIPELGMYHYKARIYSPYLGRFLQTDPIGYEDQFNLYAYVGGDPVNLNDPTGLMAEEPEERPRPKRRDEGSNIVTRTLANIIAPLTGGEGVDSVEGSIIEAIEAPLEAIDSVAAGVPVLKAATTPVKAGTTAVSAVKPLKATNVRVSFGKAKIKVRQPKTGKAETIQRGRAETRREAEALNSASKLGSRQTLIKRIGNALKKVLEGDFGF